MSQIQPHQLTVAEVLKQFSTDLKKGLTSSQAAELQKQHGLNELRKKESESLFDKIKEQFEDILVRMLLISAIISFVISMFSPEDEHSIPPWVEPCVIFTILILNAIVGIYQDYDAERALEALKDLQSFHAVVLRDGSWVEIQAKDLVPGDIAKVQQGDRIPADLRLVKLETTMLKTDQSILTGEVNPVNKTEEPVLLEKAHIQEKSNILFSGTLISNGNGIGVVVSIGMKTEMGNIQKEVEEADKEEEDSPLKKKLQEFGDQLAKIIGVICLVIWIINFRNFFDPAYGNAINGALYYFKVAVALAVAAIPEGLPAVITTCLALGTRRMAKEHAIVRKLPSVQTLGCTTVICSDKTGTLTTNEMVVNKLVLLDEINNEMQPDSFQVEGYSFNPIGEIKGFEKYGAGEITRNAHILAACMSLCNDSKLLADGNKKDKIVRVGLPTEAALKVFVEKLGKYDKTLSNDSGVLEFYNNFLNTQYKKLATLEFTRDRKSMSVVCQANNKSNIMFIKGAPEYLINKSSKYLSKNGEIKNLNEQKKKNLQKEVTKMALEGLRTLAICVKFEAGDLAGYDGSNHPSHKLLNDLENYAKLENEPIIVGLVGLQDPPRPEVKGSIKKCMDAGISVIMITGDIKETAETIGKSIGIVSEKDIDGKSFTGAEFESFSLEKQNEIFDKFLQKPNGMIFSRTEPKHKRQLVQLLSKHNQIVAMTGDGVNDAPALKQAHIGIAMGINGTEVAKEASDMILADDNFATIVAAVEEGRAIYNNMKAFIRYMISSNIGEVVSIFLTSMLGIPDGFSSIQLLWVNLVTDGLPATALSFNPPDPDVMTKPPRKHDEPIITSWVFVRYMVIGTYVGLATVGIFTYWYLYYDWAGDGHTLVTFYQLRKWTQCDHWENFQVNNFSTYNFKNPCSYFTWGKQKASTLSLSVIVVIEMFNAINALSEDSSLFSIGLFGNVWLLAAAALSILLHSVILYVPFFANVFGTVPLTCGDWALVVLFSFPVIIIDEILKMISRRRNSIIREKMKQE